MVKKIILPLIFTLAFAAISIVLGVAVYEGWFENEEAAFKQAISMTCSKIMDCETIISVVPYAVKAKAIVDTLTLEKTENVPATLLKEHEDVTVYCDSDSISLVDAETLAAFA